MFTRSWQRPGASGRALRLEEMGLAVAHQLKNPLSAVKALVQLGLRSSAESLSHSRLAAIEAEVARLQEILQGHLASGRSRPLAENAGSGHAFVLAGNLRRTAGDGRVSNLLNP